MRSATFFLKISFAASLLLCSISLLIFSLKGSPANAQTRNLKLGDYVVAGIVSCGVNKYEKIGYNPINGDVTVIGKYKN